MQILTVVTLESENSRFDEKLLEMISKEHDDRFYKLLHVRIIIGTEVSEPKKDTLEWHVCPEAPEKDLEDGATRLATYINLEIPINSGVDRCEMVFAGISPSDAACALLPIAEKVYIHMSSLFLTLPTIVYLQPQDVIDDEKTAFLLQQIREYRAKNGPAEIYLLPWDDEKTQENTRSTFADLLKTFALPAGGKRLQSNTDIATAAVIRLKNPKAQIESLVYEKLWEWLSKIAFDEEPGSGSNVLQTVTKDGDYQKRVCDTLCEIDQSVSLPYFSEILAVMPVRNLNGDEINPDDLSVDRAWRLLGGVYGKEDVESFRSWFSTGSEATEEKYQQGTRRLTECVIRCILQIGTHQEITVASIKPLIKQMITIDDDQLKRLAKNADKTDIQYRIIIPFSATRQAKAQKSAKLRHACLAMLYKDAVRKQRKTRLKKWKEMLRKAGEDAASMLETGMLKLKGEMDVYASKNSFLETDSDCFTEGLKTAYQQQWMAEQTEKRLSSDTIYALIGEDLLQELIDGGRAEDVTAAFAKTVASQLDRKILENRAAMMNVIAPKMSDILSELQLRQDLLSKVEQDRTGDLREKLVQHMQEKLRNPPLRRILNTDPTAKDQDLQVNSIFLMRPGDLSDDFKRQVNETNKATGTNTMVLYDNQDDGVRMINKYYGKILDSLVIARNNP